MKALRFEQTGSLDALQLADVPDPTPRDGEWLIQVRASGVNPSDYKNVLGIFPYTRLPCIPGRDFAGVVVHGPQQWRGRAVWGTGRQTGFSRPGSHAESLCVPAYSVLPKPETLSFAQAGALGVPYATAWEGLERAGILAGSRVLILGAGSVARAALDLARWAGAEILAAARRAGARSALQTAGFDTLELGKDDALEDDLRQHWPDGADIIYDTTGFKLTAAVRCVSNFGRISVIAAPDNHPAPLPLRMLYRKGAQVVGVNSLLHDASTHASKLQRLNHGFASGALSPPAAPEEWPLLDGVALYQALAAGNAEKTVLMP